jgi:hypothetical protein
VVFWQQWEGYPSGEGYRVSPQAALCSMRLAQALYLLLSGASHVFTRVTVRHVVYSRFTTFLSQTFQNNLLRVLYKKSQTNKVNNRRPLVKIKYGIFDVSFGVDREYIQEERGGC